MGARFGDPAEERFSGSARRQQEDGNRKRQKTHDAKWDNQLQSTDRHHYVPAAVKENARPLSARNEPADKEQPEYGGREETYNSGCRRLGLAGRGWFAHGRFSVCSGQN
jgi:hypothetical protein